MAVEDSSEEKRPLFLSREGKPKEAHLTLTVEATLYARRLLPRLPRQQAPVVADLNANEIRRYTRSSPTLDTEDKKLRDWMAASGLGRAPGEGDLAFARRAFLYLERHFRYTGQNDQDRRASWVCKAGQADCGGLSSLYVALLRANGVPARVLVGRWARSDPAATHHVKAEFFARGVGWIPVDVSEAVTDTVGGALGYFGNDPGDFVVLHVDPDLRVPDPVKGGIYSSFGMQQPWFWWLGPGSDEGSKIQQKWSVEEVPGKSP